MWPDADCISLPVADGGEGTAAALARPPVGSLSCCPVTGPLGEPVTARWALLGDGQTAVVELAEAAGLMQVSPERRDPETTTRGVGELLLAAARHPGVRHIIVGLGGSATNDGGAGLLRALGVRLCDRTGNDLPEGGAALSALATVDTSIYTSTPARWKSLSPVTWTIRWRGRAAQAVFGPQKGATPADVALLDDALRHAERYWREQAARSPIRRVQGQRAAQRRRCCICSRTLFCAPGSMSCWTRCVSRSI